MVEASEVTHEGRSGPVRGLRDDNKDATFAIG
jgi:hypothetical protein